MDGLNVHACIIDELHAHKDRGVWDVLETATGSRRQPLMFAITTAGFNKLGICFELRKFSCRVLQQACETSAEKPAGNIVDDTFFAFVASIDDEDDWTDEKCWAKANPNLGVSCKLDDLQRKCAKAKEIPASQNNFCTKHLNRWTEQSVRWLPMDKWARCGLHKFTDADLLGKPCYGGLDLASTTDICAFVLAFPYQRGEKTAYRLKARFWLPRETALKKHQREGAKFLEWDKAGLLTLTEEDVIDYAWIRHAINQDAKQFDLQEIAFDPWNATQIATQLAEEDDLKMIAFRQGFISMSEPSKEFERLVVSGLLEHGDNEILNWMAGNVAARTDPHGNIKPDKQASGEKIDGIVGGVMAVGRAMLRVDEPESVYETRGLITF